MSTANRDVITLLQAVEAQARRNGATPLPPPCSERALSALRVCVRDELGTAASTGELQLLDLVPRQVMDTFPAFDALIRVVVERCLRS